MLHQVEVATHEAILQAEAAVVLLAEVVVVLLAEAQDVPQEEETKKLIIIELTKMKSFFTVAMLFAASLTSYSQSLGFQDLALLFSENNQNGSARFTGMSGAFGAIGGDISAINVNPAGIAVYTSSAFSATFNSRNTRNTANYYATARTTEDQFFNISQAGGVFVFNSGHNNGWTKVAVGVNYRIAKDFSNNFNAKGNSSIATFRQYPLDQNEVPIDYGIGNEQRFSSITNGELSEINIAFSAVHNHQLYVGGGLNTYDLNFTQITSLREENTDGNDNNLSATLFQENSTAGTGISLNAGFIYKLTQNFRVGLAYQTPTWFTEILQDTNYGFDRNNQIDIDLFQGETTYVEGNQSPYTEYNDRQLIAYRLKTPSKFTASGAVVFGKKGLVSVDYTHKNFRGMKLTQEDFSLENQFFQNELKNTHNLTIGTEWRMDRLSVRGGYSYEQSPLKNGLNTENITGYSVGGGYHFGNTKIDLSFSDRNRDTRYNFYTQFNNIKAATLTTDNRTITATLTFNL